ncbi:MAG: hypothetical protein U0Q15_14305 [Kineosporiaceae bacterium]
MIDSSVQPLNATITLADPQGPTWVERLVPVAGAVAVLAPVAAVLHAPVPLRLPAALLHLLLCPGIPLVAMLRWQPMALAIPAGIVLSLSAAILASTAFLLAGAWYPIAVQVVLSVVTLALVVPGLLRNRRTEVVLP